MNGVVSAPGSPAKSQSQNTRWQAACPMVAHIGHRSDDGWIASCSSVIAATTSRRRSVVRGPRRIRRSEGHAVHRTLGPRPPCVAWRGWGASRDLC